MEGQKSENLWYALKCSRIQSELSFGSVKSHYSAVADEFFSQIYVDGA